MSDQQALVPLGDLGLQPPSERTLVPRGRAKMVAVVFAVAFLAAMATRPIPPPLGSFVWLGVFVSFVVSMRRRAYAAHGLFRDAVAALEAGDTPRATRLAAAMLRRAPFAGPYRMLAIVVWGRTLVRRGLPEEAARVLGRVAELPAATGRTARLTGLWSVAGEVAVAETVAGRVEVARRWIARAERIAPASSRGVLLLARVFLACREEDWKAALDIIDGELRTAESHLKPLSLRQVHVLEAFALEHIGDSYRDDRARRSERAMERAREAEPGSFDYLAVRWPELQGFLERHALARRERALPSQRDG